MQTGAFINGNDTDDPVKVVRMAPIAGGNELFTRNILFLNKGP